MCSQLAFVRIDVLLGPWAAWEGSFTEVTGWVLPAGIKISQTTGNKKQVLGIKRYSSSDLSKTDFMQKYLVQDPSASAHFI